jgi:hypothetical protein
MEPEMLCVTGTKEQTSTAMRRLACTCDFIAACKRERTQIASGSGYKAEQTNTEADRASVGPGRTCYLAMGM